VPVAPGRRERKIPLWLGAELPGEAVEVRGARAPPAIDRLVGVSHRHHRQAGEQFGEQQGLHHTRVLVFVEQHHPVLLAEFVADARHVTHDREREGDLVGVFDETPSRLRLVEAGDEVDFLVSPTPSRRQVDDRAEAGGEGRDIRRIDQVFAYRMSECEHCLRHRVDALVESRQAVVSRADHDGAGELPGGCLAEHRPVALPAEQDCVVTVNAIRERVVGGHRRRIELVVVSRKKTDLMQLVDALSDACG